VAGAGVLWVDRLVPVENRAGFIPEHLPQYRQRVISCAIPRGFGVSSEELPLVLGEPNQDVNFSQVAVLGRQVVSGKLGDPLLVDDSTERAPRHVRIGV
jgi:hypothetical protein